MKLIITDLDNTLLRSDKSISEYTVKVFEKCRTQGYLIAFATATTGPIAFVAFLAGPIASKLVGKGSPNVIPSALVGALLVLASDMIGQFVFSTRFPVGVITGILGAPYMLFLLICVNKRGEV